MSPSKFSSFSSFRTVGALALMATLLSQFNELEGHIITSRVDDSDTVVSVQDSSRDSSPQSPSDCLPVTNEILWVRLNLHTIPVGTWTPRPDKREPRPTPAAVTKRAALPRRHGPSGSSRRRRDLSVRSGDLEGGLGPSNSSAAGSTHPNRKRPDARRHDNKHRQKKKIQNPKRNSSSSVGEQHSDHPESMLLRSTSWQCRMESQWKKMEEGTFPSYLQTGRCRQERCMEGLYVCTPKRYAVKVLKRIPNVCYPLPVHGRNSSFEDAWTFSNYNVIVGCECTRKREVGMYYSSHSPSAELGDNS